MKRDFSRLQVPKDKKVVLGKWPTRIKPLFATKPEYNAALAATIARLDTLQQQLYASGNHALLLIFQGMDTSGKDGMIRHVLSGLNPQGCRVTSFKQPSAAELRHDFLWRSACVLPERGQIGVFNRSYYEEVIVTRVHPALLAAQKLVPAGDFWDDRYRSINDFEQHLHANGTIVLKFFLHLSKDEQRKRLLARIDEPAKNWKMEAGDVTERVLWSKYMDAYGRCLGATSTRCAPWRIIPADEKEDARHIVSRILLQTLEGLDLSMPPTTAKRKQELQKLRRALAR